MNRQIFLFSPIDSYSSEYIIRQLLDLDRQSNDEITMFINSPGGSVTQMFAIIDTMRMIKSPVRTVVMGIAASAAAVIASAGKVRLIASTAQIMIHQVSAGTFGSIFEMQETMDQIVKANELMLGALSKNTGRTADELKNITNKVDKYFSAKEAVSFGLADRVIMDSEAQVLKLSEGINVEGYEVGADDKEIQLLRDGKFVHPTYGELLITDKTLELMKMNFDHRVRNIDISIDYTHDNETGESPAAFWIKSLEVRSNKDGKGKGLFAKGEFTLKGRNAILEKEFKYSSADFVIDYIDERGNHFPYVLRGGTLTNRPFIKGMNPIKLSEYKPMKKEINNMNKEELLAALKVQGLDVSSIQAKNEELTATIQRLENSIRELNALPVQKDTEIAALKEKLQEASLKIVEAEKLKVFNALMAEGKVIPAQKDNIFNTFKSGEDISAFYANAPIVVKMKASGSNDDVSADDLTAEEQTLVNAGTYTKEEVLKYRSIAKK